ncbi:MAG: hypothetical protein RR239_04280 [Oscillospiraceae bacterium]
MPMDYNYADLHDMQEKAMERVRDMQKRAKYTAEVADKELHEVQEKEKAKDFIPPSDINKQHIIRMPLNLPEEKVGEYPSFKQYFGRENAKIQKSTENKHKANLLDEVLKEPDRAMLFSLLLLLKSEGADEAILMSLLYIMS